MKYKFNELIIDSRTGLNPRKNFELGKGNNHYITIKDIQNGRIVISDRTDKIDDHAIQIIKKRSRIQNGDILFSSIGRVGDTAIVRDKDDSWDVNESVFIFTTNERLITPEYFCYLIGSKSTREKLKKNSTGSTFKSVKMGQLNKMIFEVPLIQMQRTITDNLKNLQELINIRSKQVDLYDQLIKSRFVEMFGNPLENSKNWRRERLGDLCKVINGRAYKKSELLNKGKYRVLRVGNFFTNNNWYYSNLELPSEKYCDNGDLLFAWSASFGPRIWQEEKVIYHYHIWKIDDYQENLNKIFLLEQLNYNVLLLKENTHGSTMLHLTKTNMEKQHLIVPPVALQNKYAYFVEQVDKLKSAAQQSLDETQSLFDSLMQEYFG